MSEEDRERQSESRRANNLQLTAEAKKAKEEHMRELRSQAYYRSSGNPFAITDLNRPYFKPLPDGWEKGTKSLAAQMEKSVTKLAKQLKKNGFFDVEVVEKRKLYTFTGSNSHLFEKKKQEVDPDLIDDTIDDI